MFELTNINGNYKDRVRYEGGDLTDQKELDNLLQKANITKGVCAIIANVTDKRTIKMLEEAGFTLCGKYFGNCQMNVFTYLFVIHPAR